MMIWEYATCDTDGCASLGMSIPIYREPEVLVTCGTCGNKITDITDVEPVEDTEVPAWI